MLDLFSVTKYNLFKKGGNIMALIKCPECGKEISDKAEICVNCGIKISDIENLHEVSQKKEQEIIQQQSNKTKSTIGIVIGIIVVVFFVWLIWYQSTADERARQRLQNSIDELKQTQKEIGDLEQQLDYNNRLIDLYENQ